jgi:carboxyl-terminal processing protease
MTGRVLSLVLLGAWTGLVWGQALVETEPDPIEPPPDENALEAPYRSLSLFASVMELVRENYINPDAVEYRDLTTHALEGMLSSLDPHCEFLDVDRYREVRSETEGLFGGIGVYVGIQENRNLVVTMPVPGGAAFRSGVEPGDWILKVDGKGAKGLTLSQLIRILRGKPGEWVHLTVYRPTTKETLEFDIQREIINVPTVRNAQILKPSRAADPTIGYLWVVQFGEQTLEEFDRAVERLKGRGMQGLILDLRNNPGGLLQSAVQLAGRFVQKDRVIVSTEGRAKSEPVAYYRAQGDRHHPDLPLIILINRHSASGAEIVAGALRDFDRAILVGERTYGKGSVQTIQALNVGGSDHVGLRLTTAYYYTPSRQIIHKAGITPHIPIPVSFEEERVIYRKQNAHMLSPEEQRLLQREEDRQLSRSVTLMKGILLHQRASDLLHSRRRGMSGSLPVGP